MIYSPRQSTLPSWIFLSFPCSHASLTELMNSIHFHQQNRSPTFPTPFSFPISLSQIPSASTSERRLSHSSNLTSTSDSSFLDRNMLPYTPPLPTFQIDPEIRCEAQDTTGAYRVSRDNLYEIRLHDSLNIPCSVSENGKAVLGCSGLYMTSTPSTAEDMGPRIGGSVILKLYQHENCIINTSHIDFINWLRMFRAFTNAVKPMDSLYDLYPVEALQPAIDVNTYVPPAYPIPLVYPSGLTEFSGFSASSNNATAAIQPFSTSETTPILIPINQQSWKSSVEIRTPIAKNPCEEHLRILEMESLGFSDGPRAQDWSFDRFEERNREDENSPVPVSPGNVVVARDHSQIIGTSRMVCGRKYREYP